MHDERLFIGRKPFWGPGPFIGGLLGGVLGSALFYPRPFPFYGPYGYPFYGGSPFYW